MRPGTVVSVTIAGVAGATSMTSPTLFRGPSSAVASLVAVPVFLGPEFVEPADRSGTELGQDRVHDRATQRREGIVAQQSVVVLSGEVEGDEVYVVAGHKENPEAVKKGRPGCRRRLTAC